MRVVKAGTKGGPHDDVSVSRGIGDFGISVFHRPGWCYRPEASSLSRVRFTLRAEYRGFVYEPPDLGLDALHLGATAHTAQPSAGIVFRF